MKKTFKPSSRKRPLARIDHLVGDVLAARLSAGQSRTTSISAENCHAADLEGHEVHAKDAPPELGGCLTAPLSSGLCPEGRAAQVDAQRSAAWRCIAGLHQHLRKDDRSAIAARQAVGGGRGAVVKPRNPQGPSTGSSC